MLISKGQIVAISEGEYSDYGVRDHVRATLDFDTVVCVRRFRTETPPEDDEWCKSGDSYKFIAWMQAQGYWEPLEGGELVEFHVGTYGRLEIEED